MLIDTAFILAAGKGSRMGLIGKSLPKVLWPVFDSTLLGMQVQFLKRLGMKHIWVNGHHHSQDLSRYLVENFPGTKFLHEAELLDAGGGVHNFILNSATSSPFVVLNSDQYLELDDKSLEELLLSDRKIPSTLCAMNVVGEYSSLVCRDGLLSSILANNTGPMFTGLSRINPKSIQPEAKPSKFFESVCDYKKEQVKVVLSNGVFWDFGSPVLYQESLKKLFGKFISDPALLDLWVESGMIDKNKIDIDKKSYYSNQPGVFNFSGNELKYEWPKNSVIIKEPRKHFQLSSAAIIYGEIVEILS